MASLLLFLLPFLFSTSFSDPLPLQFSSAYEVLEYFELPIGLLHTGDLDYVIDFATGRFSTYSNGTCSFSSESYHIRYQSTISGTISFKHLSNLHGVSVKGLFSWIDIKEVIRSDDELEFSVGFASADFPIENFDVCPQCGCGLNCDDVGRVKLRSIV